MTTPSVASAQPLFSWHQGQHDFITSWAQITLVSAGTGGGKTSGAYFWLAARMELYPGNSWLVGFPTYKLLERVVINQPDPDRQTLVQFFEMLGWKPVLHKVEGRIETAMGQVFFVYADSTDAVKSWQAVHCKGAWLDEFDDLPLESFRAAIQRTNYHKGWVLLTGTPRNCAWFKDELMPRVRRNDPSIRYIQFPSTANPKYPKAALESEEKRLPGWYFRRMYLGEPADLESGGVFRREWWRYYTLPPYEPEEVIQPWDTAFKTKEASDYSVGITLAATQEGFYVLDLVRGKCEFPELLNVSWAFYRKHSPRLVLIEDAASGQSLIQSLRRETQMPVVSSKDAGILLDKDKRSRAMQITGAVEAGKVFLPKDAAWVHDFVEELTAFGGDPKDTDDQVDAFVLGMTYLTRRRPTGYIAGVRSSASTMLPARGW